MRFPGFARRIGTTTLGRRTVTGSGRSAHPSAWTTASLVGTTIATTTRTGATIGRPARTLRFFARLGVAVKCVGVENLAAANPYLDTNRTVGGIRRRSGVVNVGAQGMQRDTTFTLFLDTGDFRTTETTTALDLDAHGTHFHTRREGLLHGPPK